MDNENVIYSEILCMVKVYLRDYQEEIGTKQNYVVSD